MKTSIFVSIFSLMFMMPCLLQASAGPAINDSLKTANDTAMHDDEIDLTLEENFLFKEKVYIHIYDQQDKPVISEAFSRRELNGNKAIKALLRKSTRFLQIDQHYYYFLNEL